MPSITFTCKGGRVEAKAAGFKGSVCETEIRKIMSGLGNSEGGEHILPDYYENEAGNDQTVGGG